MNNCPQSKKAIWTRGVLIGLLLATAILDFFSFAIHPEYWNFDMSPLVLMTNNILILFLVKFGVIAGIIYMMLRFKSSDYYKFLWIMCSLYLIIFQFYGFTSNREVAEQAPPPEAAPSVEVRVQTGVSFAFLLAYYPMAFSMLAFWIWRWGWME